MVLNRKGTAVEVDAILPAVVGACENWNWRRENQRPAEDLELIEFIVTEANALAVRIYEVHPFIDGNTRATWHLRNYVLMLDSLRPPHRSFGPRSIRKCLVERCRDGPLGTGRDCPGRASRSAAQRIGRLGLNCKPGVPEPGTGF